MASVSGGRARAVSTSAGSRRVKPSSESAPVRIAPDETSVSAADQRLFLSTATSRGYPHVEDWFRHQADVYMAEASDAVAAAEAQEEAQVPKHHKQIIFSRSALVNAKRTASERDVEHSRVRAYEDSVEVGWLAAFHATAQAYLDALSAMEAALLDRRAKAGQWTEKGEKSKVLATIARFEAKRRDVATRSQREHAHLARARQREEQRMKMALESCLVEIHDVVAWHTQQAHATTAAGQSGSQCTGEEEMARRRRALLAMLGGTSAVRQYLEKKSLSRPPRGSLPHTPAHVSGLTSILCRRPSCSEHDTPLAPTPTPTQLAGTWLWALIEAEEREEEQARQQRPGAAAASHAGGEGRYGVGAKGRGRGRRGGAGATSVTGRVDASKRAFDAEAASLEAHAQALQSALHAHLAHQRDQQPRPPRAPELPPKQGGVGAGGEMCATPLTAAATPPDERTSNVYADAAKRESSESDSADKCDEGDGQSVNEASQSREDDSTCWSPTHTSSTATRALLASEHGDDATTALLRALEKVDEGVQRTCTASPDAVVEAAAPACPARPRVPLSRPVEPARRAKHTREALPAATKAGGSSTPPPPPSQAATSAPVVLPPLSTRASGVKRAPHSGPREVVLSPRPHVSAWHAPSPSLAMAAAESTDMSVEALTQVVHTLQEERTAATSAVALSADTSLAWLQRLEATKARAASVLLENVALEQRRKALMGDGVVAVSASRPSPPRQIRETPVRSTPSVEPRAADVYHDLRQALTARQAQLLQVQEAIATLSQRVHRRDEMMELAGRYWHRNAVTLHQELPSSPELAAVQGIPALGLHSAEDIADFIASLF